MRSPAVCRPSSHAEGIRITLLPIQIDIFLILQPLPHPWSLGWEHGERGSHVLRIKLVEWPRLGRSRRNALPRVSRMTSAHAVRVDYRTITTLRRVPMMCVRGLFGIRQIVRQQASWPWFVSGKLRGSTRKGRLFLGRKIDQETNLSAFEPPSNVSFRAQVTFKIKSAGLISNERNPPPPPARSRPDNCTGDCSCGLRADARTT